MTQKNEAKDINPTFRKNILLAHDMRQTHFFTCCLMGQKCTFGFLFYLFRKKKFAQVLDPNEFIEHSIYNEFNK